MGHSPPTDRSGAGEYTSQVDHKKQKYFVDVPRRTTTAAPDHERRNEIYSEDNDS